MKRCRLKYRSHKMKVVVGEVLADGRRKWGMRGGGEGGVEKIRRKLINLQLPSTVRCRYAKAGSREGGAEAKPGETTGGIAAESRSKVR